MWKKSFIVLLLINLLIVLGGLAWLNSFPRQAPAPGTPAAVDGVPATVQLSVGQDAINTYLEYFLSEQADMSRVLSYARVNFDSNWEGELGIKLVDRVVAFNIVFVPVIDHGNIDLRVESATMGQIPLPPSLLFLVFRRLPWPNWITVDAQNNTLDVNLTKRPQRPYGIEVMSYSSQTRLLTLLVSIVPKATLHQSP